MVVKMKRNKLTEEEKLIENDIDKLKPVSGEKKAKIKKILTGARKSKSISLRISAYDLDKLKEKAERIGIPYQTLINSILHKYVTNQLLEEDEMLKTLSFRSKADLKYAE
jgi:predicted DNA binding CopG/RHH family protein